MKIENFQLKVNTGERLFCIMFDRFYSKLQAFRVQQDTKYQRKV